MMSATEVQEAGAHVVDSVRSAIDVDSVRSAISDQVDTVRSVLDEQVDVLRSAIDGQVDALRSADLARPIDALRATEIPHAAEVERLARRRPWTFVVVLLGTGFALVAVVKLRAASKARSQERSRMAERQEDADRRPSGQNGQQASDGSPVTDATSPYFGAGATTS